MPNTSPFHVSTLFQGSWTILAANYQLNWPFYPRVKGKFITAVSIAAFNPPPSLAILILGNLRPVQWPSQSPLIPSVETTIIKCGFTRVIECAYSACIVILDCDSADRFPVFTLDCDTHVSR